MMFTIRGIPTAGIAVGTAFVLQRRASAAATAAAGDPVAEAGRFHAALERAKAELSALAEGEAVFAAHLEMAGDPMLAGLVEGRIAEKHLSAEQALGEACEEVCGMFAALDDDYLRGRTDDVRDVCARIGRILSGETAHDPFAGLAPGTIVVADELAPSDTAQMDFSRVAGLVTAHGSVTSHVAIIARNKGIAALVGVAGCMRQVRTGDRLIIDGERGELIVDPDPATGRKYAARLESLRQDLSHVDKDKLVIFCAHIPFRGGTSVTDESHENYDGVLDLLAEFSEAHIMIGHTHYQQKYIHKRNGKTILEHVHGAACGAWWTANLCADGTPNGYGVYEISGNTIANQYYKSTNKEADYQIRAYSATQVFGKSGSLTFGWAANAPAMNDAKCIVANVWNSDASGNWKVSLWQNGTKVCDMTRVKTYDYWAYAYHVLYYSKSVGTTWGKNLDHYYYGNLASGTPGAADFEIVAEDGMGNTYRTSKLQTDFTGF